jgi:hypothetical protein
MRRAIPLPVEAVYLLVIFTLACALFVNEIPAAPCLHCLMPLLGDCPVIGGEEVDKILRREEHARLLLTLDCLTDLLWWIHIFSQKIRRGRIDIKIRKMTSIRLVFAMFLLRNSDLPIRTNGDKALVPLTGPL